MSVESGANRNNANSDSVSDISIPGYGEPPLPFGPILTANPSLRETAACNGPQLDHAAKLLGPLAPHKKTPLSWFSMDAVSEMVQGSSVLGLTFAQHNRCLR